MLILGYPFSFRVLKQNQRQKRKNMLNIKLHINSTERFSPLGYSRTGARMLVDNI